MPFQSEKQRRYLWANEPRIARDWTDRYGARGGGIMRIPLANGSFKNWLGDVTGYTQHNIDNQKLRNAVDAGEITEKQYKLMGGWDVAKNMPLNLGSNYKNVGRASGLYNAIKSGVSAFTGSPDAQYGDIGPLESIALNTQGATGLGKKNQMMYEDIIGGKKFFSNENEMYNNISPDIIKRMGVDNVKAMIANAKKKEAQVPIAQKLANLDKIIQEPRPGFPHDSSVYDKWGNRRMAQEKLNQYPQKKGLGEGITAAWNSLKESPLGSAVGQAFRGPQLTPQQKQMNTNFMKQYGVTRAPPTMGGRMVGGPFAGMNAPGTSAFGSKTSQEMAQKWALKNQHRQYTTPKMQQKQQNIINIATGGRDPGTGTTVTGHGKSGMGRDPSDRMARGGIAGLWPR